MENNKFSKMRETAAKRIINELVYIGFLVMFVMNFTSLNNTERFVIMGIVMMTFVGTKVYCKIQDEKKIEKEKERKDKKNDRS